MTPLLLLVQAAILLGLYLFLFWIARIMLVELSQPERKHIRSMAPGSGALLVLQGDQPPRGERFVLASSTVTLGRDPTNDLPVSDRFASGQHARIVIRNGGYWLEDLGSRNGTLVNGQRVTTATQLAPGDRLEVGDTVFRFDEVEAR